jgi:acyl-CoA thioesterase
MEGTQIPHKMLSLDAFSQWMGIEILEVGIGRCILAMTVREDMLNSMGYAHGGITYTLADTAFGFASNTHGKYAVSIESSVNHIAAVEAGDRLVAEAFYDETRNKLGFHLVEIKRDDEVVALFKGVVYRTQKDWE